MWEVKASSLGNVYLSKQYTNVPDSTRKRSPLKQFQVFEQNCQVLWRFQVNNWDHRIESARGRNQGAGTNICSFCAIKMQLYQTIKVQIIAKISLYMGSMPHTYLKIDAKPNENNIPHTFRKKNLHKLNKIQKILNNMPYTRSRMNKYEKLNKTKQRPDECQSAKMQI